MIIGFVVPGHDRAPDRLTPTLDHALCALLDELRRRDIEVVVTDLDERHWLLPPSAFAQSALKLADELAACDLVVDLTLAWGPLVRRAGRRLDLVALHRSGLAPWTDVPAFGVGNGSGGYLLLDRGLCGLPPAGARPAGARRTQGRLSTVTLPDEGGPYERAALAGEAVAFVAGDGLWSGFAAAEALACGAPVVARAGSPAAEVVDHGVTGIVVDDRHPLEDPVDLARLAAEAAELDRWACRKAAYDRFSVERAVLDLLVIAGCSAPTGTVTSGPAPVDRPGVLTTV